MEQSDEGARMGLNGGNIGGELCRWQIGWIERGGDECSYLFDLVSLVFE